MITGQSENMYEQARSQEIVDKWIAKKIKDTYVRIRIRLARLHSATRLG